MRRLILIGLLALAGCGGGDSDSTPSHTDSGGTTIGGGGYTPPQPGDCWFGFCPAGPDLGWGDSYDCTNNCDGGPTIPKPRPPVLESSPTPAVRSVTLQWMPPTENTDGTPLIDLAGYDIIYWEEEFPLVDPITRRAENPGLSAYVLDLPWAGTWSFTMRSLNAEWFAGPTGNVVVAVVP